MSKSLLIKSKYLFGGGEVTRYPKCEIYTFFHTGHFRWLLQSAVTIIRSLEEEEVLLLYLASFAVFPK